MHFLTVTNGPLSGDCFSRDQGDSYHGNRHKLKPLNEQVGGGELGVGALCSFASPLKGTKFMMV